LEKHRRRAQELVRGAEERYGRAQLETERKRDELRILAERIEEDLGLVELELGERVTAQTPLPMRPLVSELPVVEKLPEGLKEEMQFVKKRLRHLGAVNPNAPQELDEVQDRHTFLTEQAADLEAATAQLRRTVADLDALMEKAFQETFEAVAERFSTMFSRLFDGGEASLELTEPHDLLNTGVDIVARPPGKRRQRLALLSGGERALTATALLFSLLQVSPTPFCVLDEVDAMLDEANVGRFRAKLEELARETQFIVITHNRRTVESAETVYGISMGSNAVSQIVSLKMDEAQKVH
jgi:chromosome segregation protein